MSTYLIDLHIHSRYSRATSKEMDLPNIEKWAMLKGITVVGTGDFTHPEWFMALTDQLERAENGLYRLKAEFRKPDTEIPPSCRKDVFFIPTVEISSIYKRGGRLRKVHNLIIMPDLESVSKFNKALAKIGNLSADGRPILGLDSKDLLEIMLNISENSIFIPAHAWTPHFSVFGSKSGFDSLEECFGDLTPHIKAIETGLSSDPPMNWRLSALDNILLVSNSDAHSPTKLGREVNIISGTPSYKAIYNAIMGYDGDLFQGTIEFYPEEGKYHFDGHRRCQVRLSPKETIANNLLCPKCGQRVTIGVMHRVEELADRDDGYIPENAKYFERLVPLQEVLSEVLRVGPQAKRVIHQVERLRQKIGNEFHVLREAPLEVIEEVGGELLSMAIKRNREGNVSIRPGYDGEYGAISILRDRDRLENKSQMELF